MRLEEPARGRILACLVEAKERILDLTSGDRRRLTATPFSRVVDLISTSIHRGVLYRLELSELFQQFRVRGPVHPQLSAPRNR